MRLSHRGGDVLLASDKRLGATEGAGSSRLKPAPSRPEKKPALATEKPASFWPKKSRLSPALAGSFPVAPKERRSRRKPA